MGSADDRTKEREMRKTLVAATVAAILSAGAFLTGSANAITLAAPAGMRVAAEGVAQAEQVRYVCYRVKRHGTWRRHCDWRPNRSYYYGGYRPYYYRPYAYRPYYGYGYPYYYGYGRPSAGVYFRF
jgi:hypothetical protein